MDPARADRWVVNKVRCFVCEARALEAKDHADNNGTLDGLYFRVTDQDEEVFADD